MSSSSREEGRRKVQQVLMPVVKKVSRCLYVTLLSYSTGQKVVPFSHTAGRKARRHRLYSGWTVSDVLEVL